MNTDRFTVLRTSVIVSYSLALNWFIPFTYFKFIGEQTCDWHYIVPCEENYCNESEDDLRLLSYVCFLYSLKIRANWFIRSAMMKRKNCTLTLKQWWQSTKNKTPTIQISGDYTYIFSQKSVQFQTEQNLQMSVNSTLFSVYLIKPTQSNILLYKIQRFISIKIWLCNNPTVLQYLNGLLTNKLHGVTLISLGLNLLRKTFWIFYLILGHCFQHYSD